VAAGRRLAERPAEHGGRLMTVDFVPVPLPVRTNGHHVRSMAKLRKDRDELRATITAGNPHRQHKLGKRTARERLDLLLDPGSFVEIEPFRRHLGAGMRMPSLGPYTDGVVAGSGTVDGRRVFVYAQDFSILGGSLGAAHATKIHKVMDLALATGSPLVGLNDSGGARIQEGVMALDGYGGIFRRHVEASGVIPQISVILGRAPGSGLLARAGRLHVHGPRHCADVPDRAGRGARGHRRNRHPRRAWRRRGPQ